MKFKLNIPKPCHEDWQQMSPTQKGKFCASCQKEVIDFTILSATEIARKTKNAKQLCGRFTSTQLEQEYIAASQNSLSRLGIALGLGSIIAVAQPGLAQEEKTVKVKVDTENDLQYKESTQAAIQQDSITISGTVIDEEGLPLPGVNVVQLNSSHGTQTDFDGNFSIIIPLIEDDTQLEFTYVGHEKLLLACNKIDYDNVKVVMKHDPEMNEVITVGGAFVSKPNIFQRFLNLFRSKENKRYY
ncbi:carboxypeptidase-like regulatory domain-containing protein [Mesonia mobilis]|uniref:carboxypeptidase-like regulatory domain-containing protein n=1 Tax=Mesonia mobilis TaxID=369791 RepID=UPI0026F30933|nr:carboxypeptidase-like regulatory domain-containing protein [Mesonia mobilis]